MARKDGSTLIDPNPDLVGMKLYTEDGVLVVKRTWRILPTYMECEGRSIKTVRAVALLRYRKGGR